jgi:hypothetical protein
MPASAAFRRHFDMLNGQSAWRQQDVWAHGSDPLAGRPPCSLQVRHLCPRPRSRPRLLVLRHGPAAADADWVRSVGQRERATVNVQAGWCQGQPRRNIWNILALPMTFKQQPSWTKAKLTSRIRSVTANRRQVGTDRPCVRYRHGCYPGQARAQAPGPPSTPGGVESVERRGWWAFAHHDDQGKRPFRRASQPACGLL